jgi:hypothetical protein
MIAAIGVGAGVAMLCISSAYGNYTYVANLGPSIIGLVIGAELFKFVAPIAMQRHARNNAAIQFIATLVLWLLVVAFSFINTFGNALSKHANEQLRVEHTQQSIVRPEHLILKDMAQPQCNKKRKDNCVNDAIIISLRSELKTAQSERGVIALAGFEPIREGMTTLATFVNIDLPKEQVYIFVTLIWTLLAEVGSAIGALAIPKRK